ncbi:aldolase [uncultured Methanospirillum sp.]|uniref:aldolase n=1 Tax=uncultured Methanospirillum sp. TaxID=262503 RepID=UPI0029C7750C|nr:aldolase [uncultured Methanospirillum sp.]
MSKSVSVPLDVPKDQQKTYTSNFKTITHDTGRLMLFAGDQKIEHLNADFYGEGIHEDDNDPEHLFRIAAKAKIGCFATQLGLIARYGADYPDVPYLVKLNSKTNLVGTSQQEPSSGLLTTIEQVVRFRKTSGLKIVGIGYTIYLGSEAETEMLTAAANAVFEAHQNGLVTVLWIYPRGKAVKDEKDPHLIAGAAGIAACLGSDFVKVNPPKKEGASSVELMKEATMAAGRTRVVCAGGSSVDGEIFLKQLWEQIHIGGCAGNATGRNIHQKSLDEAVRMCNAIYAITVQDASVEDAVKIYEKK